MSTIIDDQKRIIDLIIEQAEIFDGRNLKLETSTIEKLGELYDDACDRILKTVEIHGVIDTTLKYQNLMNRIQIIITDYYNSAYKIITKTCGDYYGTGYDNTDQLIDLALDVEENARRVTITELKKLTPDPNAIEFMKNHAFEQVKGFSNSVLEALRSKLGESLVSGKIDKNQVRSMVADILNSSVSRADMIAQTELSLAYNSGVLARMREFNAVSGKKMLKYWHGFKFSVSTCTYCRPRIATIYDIDDNTEHLPAHPRCRCVWLPFVEGWDSPISTMFTRKSNMINRVYKPSEIYAKLNARLGIDYSDYLTVDDAARYLSGDRSSEFYTNLSKARAKAIKDKSASFDIALATAEDVMANEFNTQISFWRKLLAEGIVDNNVELLRKSYTAIKGVMILPWTGNQLYEFDKLLDIIERYTK